MIEPSKIKQYLSDNNYTSLMNNTKWERVIDLLRNNDVLVPSYRLKLLGQPQDDYWDTEWYYHLPNRIQIEWLDISTMTEEYIGQLVPKKIIDHTEYFIKLLTENNIEFIRPEHMVLRIIGHQN